MDRMSDYDIFPKSKVYMSSPNECWTFGRTLYAGTNVFHWWLMSALSSQEMS